MSFIFERGMTQNIHLSFLQQDNVFQLKPINSNLPRQYYMQVNFCRVRIQGKGVYSTTPTFYPNDSQIYNSFYKAAQEPTQPANLLEACYYFGLNRESIVREDNEIYAPRPSGNYCSVCKKEYQSYNDHVNKEDHLYKQRHNVYNLYMDDIKKVLERRNKKQKGRNLEEAIQIMEDQFQLG